MARWTRASDRQPTDDDYPIFWDVQECLDNGQPAFWWKSLGPLASDGLWISARDVDWDAGLPTDVEERPALDDEQFAEMLDEADAWIAQAHDHDPKLGAFIARLLADVGDEDAWNRGRTYERTHLASLLKDNDAETIAAALNADESPDPEPEMDGPMATDTIRVPDRSDPIPDEMSDATMLLVRMEDNDHDVVSARYVRIYSNGIAGWLPIASPDPEPAAPVLSDPDERFLREAASWVERRKPYTATDRYHAGRLRRIADRLGGNR